MLENKQFHENEIWKEIQGYEGLYAVSNRGRVKNLMSGKVLKPGVDSPGYEFVILCKNGKHKNRTVHRLTAQAFIENPDNLPQVNHIDEDKRNNDVSNLEWCTVSQNNKHSAHQHSCKISQYSLDDEFIKQWKSSSEIERELGYNAGGIINCCKCKQKTAYGYRWKYADGLHQQKQNRPIAALTKDGDLIAEYKSVAEAARCLKICNRLIRSCLNGTYKSTHGLRFIYIDD